MGAHLDRAIVLLEQSRPELAEKELRQALAASPDHPMAHALLALCLGHREQFAEATEEAKAAIHLAPDLPYAHYVLARVLFERDRYDEALKAIDEAIRLDPHDADQFGLLAQIRLNQHRAQDALQAAEQGLEVDPEHIVCTNMRAIALVRLGRKAEAGATIDSALARNPENAVTHANQGWTLLHQGDHIKALEHFRESLRLDPELEWAREGIVEALKARHFVYRQMLRFFLWMSRLTPGAQWAVIIGAVFMRRILQGIARQVPALQPWIMPILVLYMIFVLMTWTADPLFNLLLRLNRFGRLALSREQIVASNWIGGFVFVGLISLGIWLVTNNVFAILVAGGCGALLIPLSGTFRCAAGWPRRAMAAYTGLLTLVALAIAAVVLSPIAGLGGDDAMKAARFLTGVFLIGAILSPWVANGLIMARPKR